MAGENIGVGLIGYGFAGKTFHAPLISAVEGLDLRAVTSSDPAKVRRDLPHVALYADTKDMMAQKDIEVVVIATPNDSHAVLARGALEAGKHAIIDKPFALDLKQARELVELAQKRGMLLSVSVQAATWSDVFERLIDIEHHLGEPLPIGFCAGGASAASDKARMAEISDHMARSTTINRAMADIYNSTLIEGDLPATGLLERENAYAKVEPNSWLSVASGISADVEVVGDTAVLRLPGAALRADARALPFFKSLCEKERKAFRLCDLADQGDSLALIDLAKELVRRGVLIVRSP